MDVCRFFFFGGWEDPVGDRSQAAVALFRLLRDLGVLVGDGYIDNVSVIFEFQQQKTIHRQCWGKQL